MNYAYSEFEVNKSEKSGYLTLLDGTLLNYPSYVINSLDYMTIMGIISEGVNKCLNLSSSQYGKSNISFTASISGNSFLFILASSIG